MKDSVTWSLSSGPTKYLLCILLRQASLYISASFFIQLKLNNKYDSQSTIMKFLPAEGRILE